MTHLKVICQRSVVCATFFAAIGLTREANADLPLTGRSVVHFATVDEGREFVTARDMYIGNMSQIDREIRMRTTRPVTERDFQAYAAKQVLPWKEDELQKCGQVFAEVSKKLARWKLPFPDVVTLVKTTGEDEAHSAHCRGNAVILPAQRLADRADQLEHLLLHELFHILSRNNAELRDELYAVIGFKNVGTIELPDELKPLRITNPDAPLAQHAVEINYDGQKAWATPILLSNREHYDTQRGGGVFDYLRVHLLLVEPRQGRWFYQQVDGKPVLLLPKSTPSYFEQIGKNTQYIIHPEEILADNFQMLASGQRDLPSPAIINGIDRILSGL